MNWSSAASRHLAANKLLKKAKSPSAAKPAPLYRYRPAFKHRPTTKTLPVAAPHPDESGYDLSKEKVEDMFANSRSITQFAGSLMTRLFDESEILKSKNVYGKVPRGRHWRKKGPHDSQRRANGALDPARVEVIRQLVAEKTGSNNSIWKSCVQAMNAKISSAKKRSSRLSQ